MTDNEIIKALECCLSGKDYDTACMKCPIEPICESDDILLKYALDLINRQKAEIERLEEMFDSSVSSERNAVDNIGYEKYEAIKEFAERLKHFIVPQKADGYTREIVLKRDIDNLIKEMMEVNEK